MSFGSMADMEKAAAIILEKGAKGVLLKGGHLAQTADDYLLTRDGGKWFDGPRYDNPNTHGTGCSLSSSLAADLASGMTMEQAVREAKDYVALGIKNGLPVGHGHGPIHHFVTMFKKAGLE